MLTLIARIQRLRVLRDHMTIPALARQASVQLAGLVLVGRGKGKGDSNPYTFDRSWRFNNGVTFYIIM